jgi:hypothetical protein
MKKIIGILTLLGLTLGAQAEVVYLDSFDNDGLGTNDGTGGGASSISLYGGASWSDNGNATYANAGTNFRNASLLISDSIFQSDDGFQVSVTYYSDGIINDGRSLFSFGLLEDASNYSGNVNPFVNSTSSYGIGANVIYHDATSATRGLWFADGTSNTLLDASGTEQEFVASANTEVIMSVLSDGSGGADWSYSIAGVTEASGNIAVFDFSKSYNFAAYGQDDNDVKRITSVSIEAIPEPTVLAMLGLSGFGMLILRRFVS